MSYKQHLNRFARLLIQWHQYAYQLTLSEASISLFNSRYPILIACYPIQMLLRFVKLL